MISTVGVQRLKKNIKKNSVVKPWYANDAQNAHVHRISVTVHGTVLDQGTANAAAAWDRLADANISFKMFKSSRT